MPFVIHVSVVLHQQDTVLLVQERKPENYQRWNLPGGHLEIGESILEGAIREAVEETGLAVTPTELVGVYTSIGKSDYQALRFVFTAHFTGTPEAGDDILAIRWFTTREIAELPDAQIVGGQRLRAVLADVAAERHYPIDLLRPLTRQEN